MSADPPPKTTPPLVIAHRGASGDRPENTLESFEQAMDWGADFIELDIVPTQDGVLVVRHENELSCTTNVGDRPEFADRRTTKMIEGQLITGWFTEDFLLSELKILKARERFAWRSQDFNDQFTIPTLDEVIQRVRCQSDETGHNVGLYIEIKHSAYFEAIALPIEPLLLKILDTWGYLNASSPVILESFESRPLKILRNETDLPISQLLGKVNEIQTDSGQPYGDLMTPNGLKAIARYADGISPSKSAIIPPHPTRVAELLPPTNLIQAAHHRGLWVHAYTFRSDPQFLHAAYDGSSATEYQQFFELGVDGVFSDFPEEAIAIRNQMW